MKLIGQHPAAEAGAQLGDLLKLDHSAGVTERFDGDDGLCARRDRAFDLAHVHIERLRFDVVAGLTAAHELSKRGHAEEHRAGEQ